MDFFAHQDRARRQTLLLALLFPLAVAIIVMAVNGVYLIYTVMSLEWIKVGQSTSPYSPERFLAVNLALVAVIVGGSYYRMWSLRGGGDRVAEAMGAVLVEPGRAGPEQRRLLNVVEEMAIASGVPTPKVYVLEGIKGINAFAAGYTVGDAVVVVTAGAVELLERDELQGVVAHEFSHILNGDMRLNLRMMGLLYGIQLISIIGARMVEAPSREVDLGLPGGMPKVRLSPMLVVGYLLWFVGYLGVFLARLIKSAISRQREYLADAAAVQFTRFPKGLAGALLKIGGFSYGSRVRHPVAEEASHMFFGSGHGGKRFTSWTATHPPLEERIRRVLPDFAGQFPKLFDRQWYGMPEAFNDLVGEGPPGTAGAVALAGGAAGVGDEARTGATPAQELTGSIGTPQPAHLRHARELLAGLPPQLLEAVHDPLGVQGVVLALLVSPREEVRRLQEEGVAREGGEALLEAVRGVRPLVAEQQRPVRLPLVDLAMPALRRLAPGELERFQRLVGLLVEADGKVALFEYVLQKMLKRHLGGEGGGGYRRLLHSFRTVTGPVSVLLSILARLGGTGEGAAEAAFRAGAAKLGPGVTVELLPAAECTLSAMDRALGELTLLAPLFKKSLMDALCACAASNGRVGVTQGEVLRGVADFLECPLPPLLPGQMVASAP